MPSSPAPAAPSAQSPKPAQTPQAPSPAPLQSHPGEVPASIAKGNPQFQQTPSGTYQYKGGNQPSQPSKPSQPSQAPQPSRVTTVKIGNATYTGNARVPGYNMTASQLVAYYNSTGKFPESNAQAEARQSANIQAQKATQAPTQIPTSPLVNILKAPQPSQAPAGLSDRVKNYITDVYNRVTGQSDIQKANVREQVALETGNVEGPFTPSGGGTKVMINRPMTQADLEKAATSITKPGVVNAKNQFNPSSQATFSREAAITVLAAREGAKIQDVYNEAATRYVEKLSASSKSQYQQKYNELNAKVQAGTLQASDANAQLKNYADSIDKSNQESVKRFNDDFKNTTGAKLSASSQAYLQKIQDKASLSKAVETAPILATAGAATEAALTVIAVPAVTAAAAAIGIGSIGYQVYQDARLALQGKLSGYNIAAQAVDLGAFMLGAGIAKGIIHGGKVNTAEIKDIIDRSDLKAEIPKSLTEEGKIARLEIPESQKLNLIKQVEVGNTVRQVEFTIVPKTEAEKIALEKAIPNPKISFIEITNNAGQVLNRVAIGSIEVQKGVKTYIDNVYSRSLGNINPATGTFETRTVTGVFPEGKPISEAIVTKETGAGQAIRAGEKNEFIMIDDKGNLIPKDMFRMRKSTVTIEELGRLPNTKEQPLTTQAIRDLLELESGKPVMKGASVMKEIRTGKELTVSPISDKEFLRLTTEKFVGKGKGKFESILSDKSVDDFEKTVAENMKNIDVFREKLPGNLKPKYDELDRISQRFWEGQVNAGSKIGEKKFSEMPDKGYNFLSDILTKKESNGLTESLSKNIKIAGETETNMRLMQEAQDKIDQELSKQTKKVSKMEELNPEDLSNYPNIVGGTGSSSFANPKEKGFLILEENILKTPPEGKNIGELTKQQEQMLLLGEQVGVKAGLKDIAGRFERSRQKLIGVMEEQQDKLFGNKFDAAQIQIDNNELVSDRILKSMQAQALKTGQKSEVKTVQMVEQMTQQAQTPMTATPQIPVIPLPVEIPPLEIPFGSNYPGAGFSQGRRAKSLRPGKRKGKYTASLVEAFFQEKPLELTQKQIDALQNKEFTGFEARPVIAVKQPQSVKNMLKKIFR